MNLRYDILVRALFTSKFFFCKMSIAAFSFIFDKILSNHGLITLKRSRKL